MNHTSVSTTHRTCISRRWALDRCDIKRIQRAAASKSRFEWSRTSLLAALPLTGEGALFSSLALIRFIWRALSAKQRLQPKYVCHDILQNVTVTDLDICGGVCTELEHNCAHHTHARANLSQCLCNPIMWERTMRAYAVYLSQIIRFKCQVKRAEMSTACHERRFWATNDGIRWHRWPEWGIIYECGIYIINRLIEILRRMPTILYSSLWVCEMSPECTCMYFPLLVGLN